MSDGGYGVIGGEKLFISMGGCEGNQGRTGGAVVAWGRPRWSSVPCSPLALV